MPLQTIICTAGAFPAKSGGSIGAATFIGEIVNFAGNGPVPTGWVAANGQILSINANTALYSILGTTYGGDGVRTFALPNLQGVVAVGASSAHPVGAAYGEASTTLTPSELPPGSAPVNNDQPSLAIEYLIAVSGAFPGNPVTAVVT